MQCIISALKAESVPLILFYKLEKNNSFWFPFYKKDDLCLLIVGVGKKEIEKRIFEVLDRYNERVIQFINIGIAGSQRGFSEIGNIFLINKIIDQESKKNYFPDLIINSNLAESSITTVRSSVSDGGNSYNTLVDMEASEIYKVCSKRILTHQISFIKIVSDYMDSGVYSLDKKSVNLLVYSKLKEINNYLEKIKKVGDLIVPILSDIDLQWIERTKHVLKLTETQYHQLISCSKSYRLKNPNKILDDTMVIKPSSKFERNNILKAICENLSA